MSNDRLARIRQLVAERPDSGMPVIGAYRDMLEVIDALLADNARLRKLVHWLAKLSPMSMRAIAKTTCRPTEAEYAREILEIVEAEHAEQG